MLSTPHDPLPTRRSHRGTFLVCTLAALLEGLDNQAIGVAAPRLVRGLVRTVGWPGIADFQRWDRWTVSGSGLGGRLADRWSRTRARAFAAPVRGVLALDGARIQPAGALGRTLPYGSGSCRGDAEFHRTRVRGCRTGPSNERGDGSIGCHALRRCSGRPHLTGGGNRLGLATDLLRGGIAPILLALVRWNLRESECRNVGAS